MDYKIKMYRVIRVTWGSNTKASRNILFSSDSMEEAEKFVKRDQARMGHIGFGFVNNIGCRSIDGKPDFCKYFIRGVR